MNRSKHATLALIGACLLGGCRPPPGARPGVPAGAKPVRLLMTIVVDQFPAWLAQTRWDALPADGGFARLRREGLTAELRYAHAATDTGPGHAALVTGRFPRDSGIFANEVLGDDLKPRSILLDPATQLVDLGEEPGARPGSSLARLRGETLADALVAAAPGARVYSFSLKDRGALFGGGRHPTTTLWLDVTGDSFATSSAFPAPPAWAGPLAARAAVAAARKGGWALGDADRDWVAAHAETPDDQPGEGDLAGLGRVFPHAVGSTKALRATPLGDRVLFALAGAALGELAAAPADGPPALLALSLSSHDYVAHVFGPHSWEAWAMALELDRNLAKLLAAADRAVGPDNYAVLLTSDHGGSALPEVAAKARGLDCSPGAAPDRWERSCAPRRLSPETLAHTLNTALTRAFGGGPWVAGVTEPLVFFGPHGHALVGDARRRLVAVARRALAPLGIDDVVDARAAQVACPSDDGRATLVCRSLAPGNPADLYLVVAPGAFLETDLAPGAGTNHGSPYLYDRAVPLLVRAPGRVTAGATRAEPVSFTAFARTAASLLGLPPLPAVAAAPDLAQ